jgi:opacity protein-like surface antigen
MKLTVIDKPIIRCLLLGITNLFLADNQCYAKTLYDDLYLKFELPVYKKLNFKDKKQGEQSLTFSNYYAAGAGYIISPYLEAELMFGQSELHSEESGVKITSSTNSYSNQTSKSNLSTIGNKEWFGFAQSSTANSSAYCANNAATFLTKEDICGTSTAATTTNTTTTTNNCTNISGSSTSIKLNTLILSTKLKFLEQKGLFTPYIFGGLGVVFGESKTTQFSKDIVGGHSLKKRTTRTLGLELGLGTKIMLSQKINLEVSAKYFDYGKYALSKDVSKKIDGYKLSIGVMCFL